MDTLPVQLLSNAAKAPTRGSAGAAGYDLYAARDECIAFGMSAVVPTDVAVAIPEGYYGRVCSRSSLATRHQLEVGAGVIDSDYRGGICVLLRNHHIISNYTVKAGDRIAQLVIHKIETPVIKVVNELPVTERGAGGFGSTGV